MIVFAHSRKDSKALPKGALAVREQAGNTIPMVFVTSADGSEGIEGIPYTKLKGDTRGVARDLKKRLKADNEGKGGGNGFVGLPPKKNEGSGMLAESQAWTNADGKEIIASVKRVEDGNVHFIMPNGMLKKYDLKKLSEESQKKIGEIQE